MKHLSVFAPGTACVLGDGIPGIITGIMVDAAGIQYRVAWWEKRTRKHEWVYDYEINGKADTSERISIGFCDNGEPE